MSEDLSRTDDAWWPGVLAGLGRGETLRCFERSWSGDEAGLRAGPFILGPKMEADTAWFGALHRCLSDEALVVKGMAMLHRPDPGYIVTTDEDPAPRLLLFIDLEGRQVGSIVDGEERWFDCLGTSEPFARLTELIEEASRREPLDAATLPEEADAS